MRKTGPPPEDRSVSRQIRSHLRRRVGESTFDIWLDPIKLIALDSDHQLVLAAPPAAAGWTSKRFGRLIAATASEVGRDVRFATEAERHAFDVSSGDYHAQSGLRAAARSTLGKSTDSG